MKLVKNPSANAGDKTRVWSLGREDPLGKGTATHFSNLAWEIPRADKPGGLQSMGSQGARHDWVHAYAHTHTHTHTLLLNRCASLLICVPSICSPPFPTCSVPWAGEADLQGLHQKVPVSVVLLRFSPWGAPAWKCTEKRQWGQRSVYFPGSLSMWGCFRLPVPFDQGHFSSLGVLSPTFSSSWF